MVEVILQNERKSRDNLEAISLKGSKPKKYREDNILVDEENRIFLLADGMGGKPKGERASRLLLEIIYPEMIELKEDIKNDNLSDEDITESIKYIVKTANTGLKKVGEEYNTQKNWGTTLDIALVYNNNLYTGHVGDSGIFIVDGKRPIIEEITTEHLYLERAYEELSGVDKKIVTYNSPLTRYMGGEEVEADVNVTEFKPRDTLIMGSDALIKTVLPEEILSAVYSEEFSNIRSLKETIKILEETAKSPNKMKYAFEQFNKKRITYSGEHVTVNINDLIGKNQDDLSIIVYRRR